MAGTDSVRRTELPDHARSMRAVSLGAPFARSMPGRMREACAQYRARMVRAWVGSDADFWSQAGLRCPRIIIIVVPC